MDAAHKLELIQAPPVRAAGALALASQPSVIETGTLSTRLQVASNSEGPFAALSNATVMMVDDDPLMIEVVQTFLEDAGYTSFVTTSSPTQAMSMMAERRPDILLLDLMMPEVSGFDILTRIRGDEELRYTPVIILTAESDPAARLKALELGATDFLTKPVDSSELRLRLRNALGVQSLPGSSSRLRCAYRTAESREVSLGAGRDALEHAPHARMRTAAHRP